MNNLPNFPIEEQSILKEQLEKVIKEISSTESLHTSQ